MDRIGRAIAKNREGGARMGLVAETTRSGDRRRPSGVGPYLGRPLRSGRSAPPPALLILPTASGTASVRALFVGLALEALSNASV